MTREEEVRLIDRALCGQPDAFRELVIAYKDRLFAFVWRIVRNHHEAEDICQTAFVKAYESLSSYSIKYAFSTWLFTIGYRLCLNHMRKRRPVSAEIDFEQIGGADTNSPAIVSGSEDARRLRERIWTAVDKLTPPQKSAIILFYQEGMSCQEIGKVLGMPAVTVKSHMHRAREKLREMLKDEAVDGWSSLRIVAGGESA